MAINDNQKLDWLWKKLGYAVSKTDVNSKKLATNEEIPSRLLLRGDDLWTDAAFVPANKARVPDIVELYDDTGTGQPSVETVADTTATTGRTWKTNITNWIPPQFGSTYQVKVYLDNAGSVNPQNTGTQLFAAGSGINDEWYFDYSSGILNFIGDNLPPGISGKVIYIVGAAYVGKLGNNFRIINADSANIGHMYLDSGNINMADIITAYIDSADIIHAFIDSARIDIARIDSAVITDLHATTGFISQLTGDSANIHNIHTREIHTPLIKGPGDIIIDPYSYRESDGSGNITDSGRSGRVTILGDLQVEGVQTTVNSTIVTVNDKNLLLGDSSRSSSMSDGGGIILDLGSDGQAEILYRHIGGKWELNKPLHVDHLDADSANIRLITSDSAVITRGQIGQFTSDSIGVKRIDIDSGHALKFDIDSSTISDLKVDRILTVSGELAVEYAKIDSADIDVLRVDNFNLVGADSYRFLMVDSQANLNTNPDFTANRALINFYQGGMTVSNTGDVVIGGNLQVPGTTFHPGGLNTSLVNMTKAVVTSLEPGQIVMGGTNDSLQGIDDVKYNAIASTYGTFDGLNISFEPIMDSGYYNFNVDRQTGRIQNKNGFKLGRDNFTPIGQYIQSYPYDKGANTRPFYGLELNTDSGLLTSTAYRNVFLSPRLLSADNNDSFDVIDVKGLEDSTIFQVKADGSINFTGNILKGGQIFSGGGIFTKTEETGDAFYDPPASILDPAQNPQANPKNAFGYGKVALKSQDPKYDFSVDGTFAVKGFVDSAAVEYVLTPDFEFQGVKIADDSDMARQFFVPSRAAFRAGQQDSIGMNLSNIGIYSTSIGYHALAKGKSSIAMGWNTDALGEHAVAIGHSNTTGDDVNPGGVAIGGFNRFSSVPGQTAHGIGIGFTNTVKGDFAKAIGSNNIIAGGRAGVFGDGNILGDSQGDTTTGNAGGSFAIGIDNTIDEAGAAYVMGFSNRVTSKGNASVTIGNNNFVDEGNAISIGNQQIINANGGIGIGPLVRIDSSSNFSVGISLNNNPMHVKDANLMSIQGGNVSVGRDSDMFKGGGFDPNGNLYVSGTIVVGGRYLVEGASGQTTTSSPWDDNGFTISTNLGRTIAVNKTTSHQAFEIKTQDGATLAMGEQKAADVAFPAGVSTADSDLFDSANTQRSLLSYIPKAGVFRVGSVSSKNLLKDSNIGYGSIAMGTNNLAAGKNSVVIGTGNSFTRGGNHTKDQFLLYNSTVGENNIVIGHSNISDSHPGVGFGGRPAPEYLINSGKDNIILGSNIRLANNVSNAIVIGNKAFIGDPAQPTDHHIYLHNTAVDTDSALNNTKVSIGKGFRDRGQGVHANGNAFGNYALDIRGDIHLDSGGEIFIGQNTIREHLGFGGGGALSGGPGGVLNTIGNIVSIENGGGGVVRVTTSAPHGFTAGDPNLAVQFDGIDEQVDSVNGIDSFQISSITSEPLTYFPDVINANSFRLLHDSPGNVTTFRHVRFSQFGDNRGPTLIGDGPSQHTVSNEINGEIKALYWTKPVILPPDLHIKGDLRVDGKTLDLVADSSGVVFTARGISNNTMYYKFDSTGIRVNSSTNGLGELSLDSHLIRDEAFGGKLVPFFTDYLDTDYVQQRVSLSSNFVAGANELYYKPNTGVKPVQIGLEPGDVLASDARGNKADHAMHVKVLSGQGAVNIRDDQNLLGVGTFTGTGGVKSPITVNGEAFPTVSYLSQPGMIDAAYINARVSVTAATIENFIDDTYVKGIVDSAYILSAANDSSEWQRIGDRLFFGTYPNVQNVNVAVGTDSPNAKFHVAGSFQSDSALIQGPLVIQGSEIRDVETFEFQIGQGYLAENLQSNSKQITNTTNPTLSQTLISNTTTTFQVDLGGTPDRFFDVFRIDLNGDSQQMIEGVDWDYSTPGVKGRFIDVKEAAFDSDNLGNLTDTGFFAKDRRAPANFAFTGPDRLTNTLDYQILHSTVDLLDSLGNAKYLGIPSNKITLTDSSNFSIADSTIIQLRDIVRLNDRDEFQTSSMSVHGPAVFTDGKTTFKDSVALDNNAILHTLRQSQLKVDGIFSMDSTGDNVLGREKFFLDGKNFRGNIEDFVDSNYIGNRAQGVWNQNVDSFGIQQIFYERAGQTGAVIIGPVEDWPGAFVGGQKDQLGNLTGKGDSDTKLFVSRGNVIFSANQGWDGVAGPTTQEVVPTLKRPDGPKFMWIPTRGALRVGAIDGTTTKWNDKEIGLNSIGIGYNAEAYDHSQAIGYQVTAGDDTLFKKNATSIGRDIANPQEGGIAFGRDIIHSSTYTNNLSVGRDISASSGNTNTVFGRNISASLSDNVAIGKDITVGSGAVAIGLNADANPGGLSIGKNSNSTNGGIAIGSALNANFSGLALGQSIDNTFASSTSIGQNIGNSSGVAIGQNQSISIGGVVIGRNNSVSQSGQAIGDNQTSTSGAILIGRNQTGGGFAGLAVGEGNDVSWGAVMIGQDNGGSGFYGDPLGIGRGNTGIDRGAIAIGDNNKGNSYGAVVIGKDNINNGKLYGGSDLIVGVGNDNTGSDNAVGKYGGGSRIFGSFNKNNTGSRIYGSSNNFNRRANIWGNDNTNTTDGGYGYIYGSQNTLFKGGYVFGTLNTTSEGGYAYGVSNAVSENGYAFGAGNTVTKVAYAFGSGNTATGPTGAGTEPLAFGHSNTVSSGGLAFGENNTASNRGISVGNRNTASGERSTAIGGAITVSGNNSVGIGLHASNSGTITADNTLAILGGKVGVNQASVAANYIMEVAGNFNIPGPSDYYRHGKRLADYITDDVANDAYVKGIADQTYVRSHITTQFLRDPNGPMSPNFFFASNLSTNDLRYLGAHSVGIGREPQNLVGLQNPKLDVAGPINFDTGLYLSGTKIVPSIDSIGDVYISHQPQNYFIGADSATEVFDSDYVFSRQRTFGMGKFDSIQNTVTSSYINQRLDTSLFLDSFEATQLITDKITETTAFQFDNVGRTSLTTTEVTTAIGSAPFGVKVGINTNADFTNTLKVEGDVLLSNSQLKLNGAGAGIFINGEELAPVSVFTEGFAYTTYDLTKNIGIQKATPLVELDVGGTINADNIQVGGQDILTGILDSNYIQLRTLRIGDGAGLDSARTTGFIDSAYVQARADSDWIKSVMDSDHLKFIIDTPYVKSIADSDYIKTAADQTWIRLNADSDYIKSAANRTWIRSNADSDYVKSAANQAWIRLNADSDYIKTSANQTWIRLNADSDYIKSAANRDWIRLNADSNYILSAADSDYVKTVVDSAYTHLLTGIGLRNVDFAPHKVFYKNSVAQTVDLPNATSNEGNVFIDQQRGFKPYIGRNGSWERVALAADVDSSVSALIDAAPGTLDTLNELAAALGDDPNFATTITNSIATKLAIADFNTTADTWLTGKTTDNLTEGSSNLYYTDTRFDNRLATKSTTDLSEGSNLYYTQGRFDTAFTAKSTTDLSEGTNLYYTDARVDTLLAGSSATIDGNGTSGGVIVSDGNIAIKTGTGNVASIDLYCEVNNAHRVSIKSPAHSAYSGNIDVTLPTSSGTLALLTDVAGNLDSAEAIQLIDSAYIAARTPPALTVREVDSADGINKEITGVSAINFDNFTGFQVDSTSTPGEVKVSLGSGFKTISVAGQTDIVAIGEDTLTVEAGNGVKLTTDATGKVLNIGVDSNFSTMDSAGVLGIVDSDYINNIILTSGSGGSGSGGTTKLTDFNFTATQGQTTFSGFNYTSGGLLVTVNGVAFTKGTDYTANTGTSIVFASGRDSGDEVSVYTNVAVSGSNINDSADVTSAAATVIDQVSHAGDFKSVEYTIHMSEATLNHTQISKILLTYNKSIVTMTEYGVINSFSGDSDFGLIEADENGGNIRLKLTRASGLGNIKVKTNKTIL